MAPGILFQEGLSQNAPKTRSGGLPRMLRLSHEPPAEGRLRRRECVVSWTKLVPTRILAKDHRRERPTGGSPVIKSRGLAWMGRVSLADEEGME